MLHCLNLPNAQPLGSDKKPQADRRLNLFCIFFLVVNNVIEALAAVGVASSIVQLLDFSCKLFSETRKVYSSGKSAVEDTEDVLSITTRLRDLSEAISSDSPKRRDIAKNSLNHELRSISREWMEVANSLIAALENIRTKGTPTIWLSFQLCLMTTWKKSDIEAMEKRLNGLRSQMIAVMQAMLR
jgi:hypothetical protein